MKTIQETEKLTYSVPECARVLGLSRSNTYDLVQRGILPAVRCRGRWLVPKQAIRDWLGRASAAA